MVKCGKFGDTLMQYGNSKGDNFERIQLPFKTSEKYLNFNNATICTPSKFPNTFYANF